MKHAAIGLFIFAMVLALRPVITERQTATAHQIEIAELQLALDECRHQRERLQAAIEFRDQQAAADLLRYMIERDTVEVDEL